MNASVTNLHVERYRDSNENKNKAAVNLYFI